MTDSIPPNEAYLNGLVGRERRYGFLIGLIAGLVWGAGIGVLVGIRISQ